MARELVEKDSYKDFELEIEYGEITVVTVIKDEHYFRFFRYQSNVKTEVLKLLKRDLDHLAEPDKYTSSEELNSLWQWLS